MIYEYEIEGDPVAWTSHRGFGKKSFNPHYKEKQAAQWALKIQNAQRPLITRAVRVDFFFEMPTPKSMPKKLLKRIQSGEKIWHALRKDRSNLEKYAADCLIGTVLSDDNIIVCGQTEKYYAKDKPRTLIKVEEIQDAAQKRQKPKNDQFKYP